MWYLSESPQIMTTKTLKKSVLNTDSDVQTFPEEEENQKKKSWEKTKVTAEYRS